MGGKPRATALLARLHANKGTQSSALGKALAKQALAGDHALLSEAVEHLHDESKNVRSGAAKIIEKVAEEEPQLVAPHVPRLLAALAYEEAQTRWMMIHTLGLCARLEPEAARSIFAEATRYLDPREGTVLRDRAITYLGYLGAVSVRDAARCFPLLIRAFEDHPDREPRVLESLLRMVPVLSARQRTEATAHAQRSMESGKGSTRKWARTLLEALAGR